MAKVKPSSLSRDEREAALAGFLDIVTSLKTKDEAIDFLFGILTPSEALMLSRRMQIAELLLRDSYTYDGIRESLGVGYRTIAMVERWLNTGNDDRDVWLAGLIRRGSKGKKSTKRVGSRRGYSMSLLGRYPHHRILSDLIAQILR